MWPIILDMTKEESVQYLRNLELEAYSHLVSALRAQGPLNSDKRKLLKDTSSLLNITQERHKAEVRRAINDEKLNTIAYHITGHTASSEDWAQEGRRLVPLLLRSAPQTVFSAIADDVADSAFQCNKQLPLPSTTERKRHTVSQINPNQQENNKNIPFRVPDPPKLEEPKKRKVQVNPENSSLAQHLLSPKYSRIQQLYRQRSKPKPKEVHKKSESEQMEIMQQQRIIQPMPHQSSMSVPIPTMIPPPHPQNIQHSNQKVTVLQNISLQPIKEECTAPEEDTVGEMKPLEQVINMPVCSNENQIARPKMLPIVKPNTSIAIKPTSIPSVQIAGISSDNQKTKMCSAKKTITKTVNSGQKLIVVSNAQTLTTNSILQRTLQIPFVKNVSIKNFDKFKIVTTNSSPTSIQVANVTNSSGTPIKHKVVTVKTNPITKKVIPLSQLQVLNSKGSIKVLPLGGKIVGKTVGTTSSPLYIMNTSQLPKNSSTTQFTAANKLNVVEEIKSNKSTESEESDQNVTADENRENGKSSVLADILKASGVITEAEDYDAKIEEFHIPQNKIKIEDGEDPQVTTNSKDGIEELEYEKTDVQNVEYEIMDLKKDEILEESENKETEYTTTELMPTEIIEAENELAHMDSDHEMSHVEEIIHHHDINEVTIGSEEEEHHQVILQIDSLMNKSDIADDN